MSAEKIANAILDGACGGNVGVGHGPRGAIVCNPCVAVAIRAAQVEAAEEMRERCLCAVFAACQPNNCTMFGRIDYATMFGRIDDAIRALPIEELPK